MDFFKKNKCLCIHFLTVTTILLILLFVSINMDNPANLVMISIGLVFVFLYAVSMIFFSKVIPFFEIGYLFAGGIIILIEGNHFQYAYFITAIAVGVILIESILFSITKHKHLPYAVLHPKLYFSYKIVLAIMVTFIGYGYTKMESYVLYSVLCFLGLALFILLFYIYEWYFYEKQRKRIYLGIPIAKIKNYDRYHEHTFSMIHLLNSQYYLTNGKYLEAIKEFDKINGVHFHERLEYNRVYIILTALLGQDYQKTIKVLEESKKYTRFYKGSKSRKYVENLLNEFRKYIDIYFGKTIKYDLEEPKKMIYKYHYWFFSTLFFKRNKNEKKSQEYWTLLTQKRSLPIEVDILNR